MPLKNKDLYTQIAGDISRGVVSGTFDVVKQNALTDIDAYILFGLVIDGLEMAMKHDSTRVHIKSNLKEADKLIAEIKEAGYKKVAEAEKNGEL